MQDGGQHGPGGGHLLGAQDLQGLPQSFEVPSIILSLETAGLALQSAAGVRGQGPAAQGSPLCWPLLSTPPTPRQDLSPGKPGHPAPSGPAPTWLR